MHALHDREQTVSDREQTRGKGVCCIFLGHRSQNRDIQSDRRTANQCHLHR